MNQTKRYFVTSEKGNKFPPEFINSKNRKYIVVELHADFVKVDHHKNHFVNFVNDLKYDPCKYEYFGQYPFFNIWFTDMKGNMIEPEAFTVRLLLIY